MPTDELPSVNLESSLTYSSLYDDDHTMMQQNKTLLNKRIKIDEERQPGPKCVKRNSSENEDFGTLAETVKALRVEEEVDVPMRPQTEDLLQLFIQDLPECDTTFLKQYLDVIQNNNRADIKDVTNNIVSNIEQVVRQQSVSKQEWPEHVLMTLLSWLCILLLCLTDPHIQPPYRVFRQLLTYTDMKVRVRLASACWRHLSPAQLVELADAAAAPGGRADTDRPREGQGPNTTLTDLLLRAALCRLQPQHTEPQWFIGGLEGAEVSSCVTSAWSAAGSGARSLLTRVAMRARAADRLHSLPAVLWSAARATSACSQPETIKVLVDVSKLVVLFIGDEKQIMDRPTKRGRPRATPNISN